MNFTPAGYSLLPVVPEIVLAVGAMLLLMLGAYRGQRVTSLVVALAVCLLILTGAFNSWRAWGDYKLERGLMHALWGMHALLGVIVIGFSISLLAKPEPPANHRKLLTVNIVLMLILVGLASTLKVVRDKAVKTKDPTKSVRVDR